MRITISTADGNVAGAVDVPDEMELENFLALTQAEIPALSTVPVRQLSVFYSGRLINDYAKSLKDLGLSDGDLVAIVQNSNQAMPNQAQNSNTFGIDFSSIQVPSNAQRRVRPARQAGSSGTAASGAVAATAPPGMPDPAALRQALLADPESVARLRQRNPELADSLNDPDRFARIITEQIGERQAAAMRRLQMLRDNPFDPDIQRMIEQEIQQQEIESHMEHAMEHMPETFGIVTMLYIRCKVNGHEVKAFVDSGAQATIMSEECAKRCNVTRFIDRRFAGIARGVGTSKIVGRIHVAQLQIENDFLATAFNVLENAGVDMLFGLDMLKRHQCIIDLQRNVLVIGTTGTTTHFLPESELPESIHGAAMNPTSDDQQLAEALERSAHEAEAASLSASVAASNVRHASSPKPDMPGPSSSISSGTDGGNVNEEKLNQLISMGFQRENARRELINAQGDLQKAAMALIAGSLPPPPSASKNN